MRFFADSSSPARNGPSRRNGFEGWYYKQRAGDYMLAFIPGRAEDGAFVQMIDPSGTRHFSMPEPVICGDTVRIGPWLGLGAAALGGLCALLIIRRKRGGK